MDLSLVKDLNESSQYRTKYSLASASTRDIANHAFIDMIVLWILYNEYDYAPSAIEYANKTTRYGGFNTYRQSSTDLYMTLYILISKNSGLTSGDPNSKIFLDRITPNSLEIQNYLKRIYRNELTAVSARQFFQKIERDLKIDDSNYRSVRRLAQNWGLLSNNQKSLIVTRIIQFYVSTRKS